MVQAYNITVHVPLSPGSPEFMFIALTFMVRPDQIQGGGHCIGDCTPTRDRGQSEVKRSRRNLEAGQAVKLGIGGSLRTVKVSPGDRWAWLMLDSQGSRPDFRCGQRVKHENLLGQDLDRGRGWEYSRLCSVPPLKLIFCFTDFFPRSSDPAGR